VRVKYISRTEKVEGGALGLHARIFQHEYDHLNGVLFLDRLESNRDIITEGIHQALTERIGRIGDEDVHSEYR
jgi:peptide deformylase